MEFIKQFDARDCGPACLAMIAKYYDSSICDKSIKNAFNTNTDGVSLLAISKNAEKIGLKTSGGTITFKSLSTCNVLPCIVHWNQEHFVIVYKIKKRKKGEYCIYVADPAKGLVTYNKTEFCEHWISTKIDGEEKGIALLLEPGRNFPQYDLTEQKQIKNNSFNILYEYFKKYSKYFCLIILGLILGCILQLIMPFLTQSIVDVGIKNQNIGIVWLILLGELMIVVGKTANDFIRRWLLLHISLRINISLVSDFFIKLLKLPMVFFDTKLMGDLLQRMNDHSRIQNFLTSHVLSTLFSILSFAVFGIVLCIYNKTIFGIFLLGSIAYGIWIIFFLNQRKVIDYELFEQQAINQNKTYQFITTIQEIKLQDCENRRRWEWEDVQSDLFKVQMKSLKLQQLQEAGSIFINEVKNILVTVMAATAVINGNITLGTMLAIQYIVGQLNSPIEQLMSFIYSIQDVKISLERINEIHEKEGEDTLERQQMDFVDKSNKSIIIDNIDYKYDPNALNNTLESISFTIPEGKVTAIVGASGSGKTTIVKLLLGYYPVLSGNILIAGENINNYNLKWWRRQCGVVMQDGVIFSESIARNIAVDDGEIDKERLIKAAEIANIHDYIMGLPLKYNTKIGRDGVGLSQGQKQRILIARAVYKNPQFIFLDEATNALDAKNERAIVENLNE
ncbi:MAG: peptidase domain-containing ABC transporter, partial [Paludibacteraceae bacterium]|nr:peptidase domain-containing ABC transporter [Paludibacteraceae bacterium]